MRILTGIKGGETGINVKASKTTVWPNWFLLSGHVRTERGVLILFKYIIFIFIVRVEMIENADRSDKFDAANISAASFRPVCSSLFARLTRSPPAHICLPLSNNLSLIPDSRSTQRSPFRARLCPRNLPSQARTHSFLRFVPVSSSALLVCAAWLRSRSHSGSSENALLDCGWSAALPERSSSDRDQRPPQLGQSRDKRRRARRCAFVHKPTQIKHNTFDYKAQLL